MPGARMRCTVTMKFNPVRIEEKPAMKMPSAVAITQRVRVSRAVGRVEGPAGIDAAGQHGEQGEQAADHQQIPAQQIDPGKRQVARADHHGQEEIAQRRGNGGDQEEEHHHHAVHGEHLVVGLGRNQVALRRQQLDADQRGEGAAEEEEQRDR